MSRPIKEYPGEDDRRVIQGFVARNYDRMKEVNHLVVKVKEKDLAKEFIRNCIPLVATAEDNGAKTSLNVGFTFKGLRALLEERICDALAKKPELQAFVKGAVDRAGLVGDRQVRDRGAVARGPLEAARSVLGAAAAPQAISRRPTSSAVSMGF